MSKITVIGAGSVGSTIANDLMIQGISSEIVLIDVNKQKAFGEAMDIYQGAPFCSPTIVRSGDYDAASGSDIVIITSGLPRKAGQSRLELAQANVNIIKDIAPQITAAAPDAIYIIVSNPVDVLTYVFHKISGVPESHIIGSGTILDTSRLQSTLAKRFCISPKNVHAHVYGEHGDSSFVPWSLVHIANNHIDSYKEHSPDCDRIKWNQDYEEIEQFVKTSGAQVIKNKGATFYAVAMSVCHLCKCVQSTAGTAVTVSTMMHGEYGVSDVCLSTLALVDNQGVRGKILNCLKSDYTKIFKSEVITDLLRVLGCGVEVKDRHAKEMAGFDLSALRWNKVVICTDADVDGFQIRTLILTMLYRLTPTLIQEGYVYIAESPLFEITCKGDTWFAYSNAEKDSVVAKLKGKKCDIQRSKGLGENDPDMMWLTTMNPDTRRLIKVMPEDVKQTATMFDLLLGDDLQGRKNYIASDGHLFLDLADIS